MFERYFFYRDVVKNLRTKGEIKGFGTGDLKLLCDGLYANGYDANRASDLFAKVFCDDHDAFNELYTHSGAYGIAFLQPLKDQLDRERLT